MHGIFLRLETFGLVASARKAGGNTVQKIVSEAMRLDGYCSHIDKPTQPVVIYGQSPLLLIALLQNQPLKTCRYLDKRNGTYRSRRQRSDHPRLIAGVISVPDNWKQMDARWSLFKEQSVLWLEKTFGPQRLFAVVEHTLDEKCLHLHFFVVPLEHEDTSDLHPGLRALQTLSNTATPRQRKTAYRQAMSGMLDAFHTDVGCEFELVRRHINARRMTRSEWHRWRWYRDQETQQRLADQQRNASQKQASLDSKDRRIVASHNEKPGQLVRSVDAPLLLPSSLPVPLSFLRPSTFARSAMESLNDITGARIYFRQGNVKGFMLPTTTSPLRQSEHDDEKNRFSDEFTPAKEAVWVRPRQ